MQLRERVCEHTHAYTHRIRRCYYFLRLLKMIWRWGGHDHDTTINNYDNNNIKCVREEIIHTFAHKSFNSIWRTENSAYITFAVLAYVHVLQEFKFSRKKKQQQRQQKKKRQRCCWANRLFDVKLFWLRKIERTFLCVVHNLSLIRQVYYCFVYCLAFSSVSLFSIKYYVIYWVVLLFSPFQWAKLGGKSANSQCFLIVVGWIESIQMETAFCSCTFSFRHFYHRKN